MEMKPKRKNDSIFEPYLIYDEELVWVDQPLPTRLLSKGDIFLIPFSLMWGGFAIFWTLTAALSGAPFFFVLWGIPFVVVGQYLIWGRFVHKYLKRKHTVYAITTHRAMILNTLGGRSLTSYDLDKISPLILQSHNLLFGEPVLTSGRNNYSSWIGETQSGFYALSDAESVYHTMRNLLGQKPKRNE